VKASWLVHLALAFLAICCCFYFHIDQHNEMTCLKIRIPTLLQELQTLREDNRQLQYAIDSFESPENLLKLSEEKTFAHLKQPLTKDILTMNEGIALDFSRTPSDSFDSLNKHSHASLAAKTHP
jgi:hypothetical protein